MFEKFKLFLQNDQIFFGLMLILVGITSFALGRASVEVVAEIEEISQPSFKALDTVALPASVSNQKSESATRANSGTTELVASKSGSKYHLLTCPGAKQIKEENKIYFTSKAAAESAGYKPAANCSGLQ